MARLLADLFSQAFLPLFSQGHLTRYGATHSGLVLFTSVINEDSLTDMATDQPDLGSSLVESPSIEMPSDDPKPCLVDN